MQNVTGSIPVSRSISLQQKMNSLLEYDPETGLLRWKQMNPYKKKGWFEGSRMTNGYLCIRIEGTTYYVHKLAWIMMYGAEPEVVDHINRDVADNRLCNLRAATRSTNMMNTKVRSDNSSGHKGISWHEPTEQWFAYINIAGKRFAKYFDKIEDALSFRKKMVEKLHGEFRGEELQSSRPTQTALPGSELL